MKNVMSLNSAEISPSTSSEHELQSLELPIGEETWKKDKHYNAICKILRNVIASLLEDTCIWMYIISRNHFEISFTCTKNTLHYDALSSSQVAVVNPALLLNMCAQITAGFSVNLCSTYPSWLSNWRNLKVNTTLKKNHQGGLTSRTQQMYSVMNCQM